MSNDSWDQAQALIVYRLDELRKQQDHLSEEIQKTRHDISKIESELSGFRATSRILAMVFGAIGSGATLVLSLLLSGK